MAMMQKGQKRGRKGGRSSRGGQSRTKSTGGMMENMYGETK